MWVIYYLKNGKKEIHKSNCEGSLLSAIEDFYSIFGYLSIIKIEQECNTYY